MPRPRLRRYASANALWRQAPFIVRPRLGCSHERTAIVSLRPAAILLRTKGEWSMLCGLAVMSAGGGIQTASPVSHPYPSHFASALAESGCRPRAPGAGSSPHRQDQRAQSDDHDEDNHEEIADCCSPSWDLGCNGRGRRGLVRSVPGARGLPQIVLAVQTVVQRLSVRLPTARTGRQPAPSSSEGVKFLWPKFRISGECGWVRLPSRSGRANASR